MIAGMMIHEETTMQWRYLDTTREVEVIVCDSATGETAKLTMPARAFAASMALAIDPDGMDGGLALVQAALYAEAEAYQPPSPSLRWIP